MSNSKAYLPLYLSSSDKALKKSSELRKITNNHSSLDTDKFASFTHGFNSHESPFSLL